WGSTRRGACRRHTTGTGTTTVAAGWYTRYPTWSKSPFMTGSILWARWAPVCPLRPASRALHLAVGGRLGARWASTSVTRTRLIGSNCPMAAAPVTVISRTDSGPTMSPAWGRNAPSAHPTVPPLIPSRVGANRRTAAWAAVWPAWATLGVPIMATALT